MGVKEGMSECQEKQGGGFSDSEVEMVDFCTPIQVSVPAAERCEIVS